MGARPERAYTQSKYLQQKPLYETDLLMSIKAELRKLWVAVGLYWIEAVQGLFAGTSLAAAYLLSASALAAIFGGWRDEFRSMARELGPRFPQLILLSLAVLALCALPFLTNFSIRLLKSWRWGFVRGLTACWAGTSFVIAAAQLNRGRSLLLAAAFVFTVLTLAFAAAAAFRDKNFESGLNAKTLRDWLPSVALIKPTLDTIDFDNPITDWRNDLIGRVGIVESTLSRALIDHEPVIGLVANFGEGKSSVLNLLESSMNDKDAVIVVRFSSWLPGSEATLLSTLFEAAVSSLRKRYVIPELRKTALRYARTLAGIAPHPLNSLKDLIAPLTQSQEIGQLRTIFRKLPVKVVLLIDELDRMEFEELHALFKVLRGVPDVPNLTFICAYNRTAVEEVLTCRGQKNPGEYIKKFFPLELQIPRIDERMLEDIFDQSLDSLTSKYQVYVGPDDQKDFQTNITELWHQIIKRRFTNFRSLGQFLRSFEVALKNIEEEVNGFDLVVVEAVRLLLPDVYAYLYTHAPYFYFGGWKWGCWLEMRAVDEKERKQIREREFKNYFDSLDAQKRQLALDLLSRIFPTVEEFYKSRNSLNVPSSDLAERRRRICHPDFFPRYFTYAVPSALYGQRALRTLVDKMRLQKSGDEALDIFTRELQSLSRTPLRRADFLDRFPSVLERLTDDQASRIGTFVASLSEGMHGDVWAQSDFLQLRTLIFKVAAKLEGPTIVQSFLENAIANSGSDSFASDIWYYSAKKRAEIGLSADWGSLDTSRIDQAYAARMRRRHAIGESFDFHREDIFAFIRWREIEMAEQEYIASFFRTLFEADASNVGAFVQWLYPAHALYEGNPVEFVSKFLPLSEFLQALEAIDEKKLSREHREAIERFRRLYSQSLGGPPIEASDLVEDQSGG